MSEETETKDKFWLYVGATVFSLIVAVVLIKESENDKFDKIKQQQEEEKALMNIRVLN